MAYIIGKVITGKFAHPLFLLIKTVSYNYEPILMLDKFILSTT